MKFATHGIRSRSVSNIIVAGTDFDENVYAAQLPYVLNYAQDPPTTPRNDGCRACFSKAVRL